MRVDPAPVVGPESSGLRCTGRGLFCLLLFLAIPRIFRLCYPEIWVEDDFYAEGAFMMSAGMRPYLDFIHVHLPLLEYLVAGYFRLVGASHLTVQILNEVAIYLTSYLVYRVGATAAGHRAALAAAFLFACSGLVFRYHVFERENFVAALILGAVLVVLAPRTPAVRRGLFLALLLGAACAAKLTAAVPAGVILVSVALMERDWKYALAIGAGTAAIPGAITLLCYLLYGGEYLFQVYLFHFFKGQVAPGFRARYPALVLDFLLPLLLVGMLRVFTDRPRRRSLMLLAALAGAGFFFYTVLSPTVWGHNYLEFLPAVAVLAGVGLDRVIAAAASLARRDDAPRLADCGWAAAGIIFLPVCLLTVTPLVNQNWMRGAYGFGYVPRDEIKVLARGIKEATRTGEPVSAPAFLCFEANRPTLVRFPEIYGVYRMARDLLRREGFSAARRQLGAAPFVSLMLDTQGASEQVIRAAIDDGSLNVVIPDSPVMLVPLLDGRLPTLDAAFLGSRGFSPTLVTEHFTMWRRKPGTKSLVIPQGLLAWK